MKSRQPTDCEEEERGGREGNEGERPADANLLCLVVRRFFASRRELHRKATHCHLLHVQYYLDETKTTSIVNG
eukprot:1138687-Pelagomonas_calceolata.AAC.9